MKIPTYLRNIVFSRDNYRCRLCGAQRPAFKLQCHHVGYDKDNYLNPETCITLCRGCHQRIGSGGLAPKFVAIYNGIIVAMKRKYPNLKYQLPTKEVIK